MKSYYSTSTTSKANITDNIAIRKTRKNLTFADRVSFT